MSDKEKRNPKAQVISVSDSLLRTSPSIRREAIQDFGPDAAIFCRMCRDFIGVGDHHGFGFDELRKCADRFVSAPTALILVRGGHGSANTWTLLVEDHYMQDGQIDLYSPVSGLIKNTPLFAKTHQLFYFPGDGRAIMDWQNFHAENPEYNLKRDILGKLGSIQTTPADCGPLCLFARTLTLPHNG